jgi:hypothetical protein
MDELKRLEDKQKEILSRERYLERCTRGRGACISSRWWRIEVLSLDRMKLLKFTNDDKTLVNGAYVSELSEVHALVYIWFKEPCFADDVISDWKLSNENIDFGKIIGMRYMDEFEAKTVFGSLTAPSKVERV